MKKILLVTTAAICAGGVASAEVSLSGEGKLGLSYSKAGAGSAEVDAISSANVKFTLSGTSDNEMIGGFGASFTLDADESVSDDKLGNPFVVYVGSVDGPLGKFEGGSDLIAADKKSGGHGGLGLYGLVAEAYYASAAVAVSADLDDAWAIGGEYAISDQLMIGAGYDQSEVMRGETAAEGFSLGLCPSCPVPLPCPNPCPCPWPWYEESLISVIELSVDLAPVLTSPITIPLQQQNFMSNSLLDSSLLFERAGLAQFSASSYDVSIRGTHLYSHFGI